MRTMNNLEYGWIAEELDRALAGKRFEKIYELGEGKFRLAFGSVDVLCELAKRLNITKYIEKSPEKPSDFAMGIRRYLEGARVSGIRQHGTDRVLIFEFEKRAGKEKIPCRLVFEMFARGNIILIDAAGKILRCYKREEGKTRVIRNSIPYTFPPPSPFSQSPSQSELKQIIGAGAVGASLSKLPLGTIYAKEALARSKIDPNKKGSGLSDSDFRRLADSLREIVSQPKPVLHLSNAKPIEFSLTELSPSGSPSSAEKKPLSSLSEGADEFYFANAEPAPSAMEKEFEGRLEKAGKRLEKQREHLRQLESELKECELAGKAIYANFEKAEKALELARKGDEAALAKLGARLDRKVGKIELEV